MPRGRKAQETPRETPIKPIVRVSVDNIVDIRLQEVIEGIEQIVRPYSNSMDVSFTKVGSKIMEVSITTTFKIR